ncbi:MAG TPA: cytochrome c oxidase subunit 3 [Steroidobacteraceae bacterium]|nr:cytochrome c oxidase subunit 3 [Steroidobacteraceae bacterium]HRX88294.1 cytochrome c oxidase subunit 3 [Steroidobacteraceae bacterium]
MAQVHAAAAEDKYYIPHSSPWPIIGSSSLFVLMFGVIAYLNEWFPIWVILPGFALLIFMFVGWFSTVIGENQRGIYNLAVDRSFRMGMMWFIFSEVMFFAAFFGALFYARSLAVPWLGGEGTKILSHALQWPSFENAWPTNGPARVGPREDGSFEIIPAFGLPAINTLILLTSGVTVTIAHHALRAGNRLMLNTFLFLTVALGFLFVFLQGMEYHHAYTELGLKLSTGIYGSTFFMLTGFHGFHVTLGAIMLLVIWFRTMNGHMTPQRHFAFEATAWYWHFVDVVWLGLFVFVYWI